MGHHFLVELFEIRNVITRDIQGRDKTAKWRQRIGFVSMIYKFWGSLSVPYLPGNMSQMR